MRANVTDAHNHFPHAALARYALGAPPALIQAGWEHDRAYLAGLDPLGADAGATRAKQIKDTELPDVLTRDNWADPRWLGKKR